MDFNYNLLSRLDRHDEDSSGTPVVHHPAYGPAPFPPPTEPVYAGPIDITSFLQPENIDEMFRGFEDMGEVNLHVVDTRLFDNIALASVYPRAALPAPIIRAALSNELNTSYFKLVQCS
jgi:hypothetical protein